MYRYKVIIFLLILHIFSVGVYSQSTYRKYYDNSVLNGNACLEIAQTAVVYDENITIGVVRNNYINVEDTLNYSRVQLELLLIDSIGDFIDTFYIYRKGFHLRTWDIFKKDSNTVLVFCSALDLVKFKNQNIGNFISIAKINLDTKQVTYHDIDLGLGDELIVKTLEDSNGYTILSQICNQAITNCDVSILRIDTNYAIQWHRVYTYNSNTFENPRDITELNGDYYFTTTSIPPGGTQFSTVHKLSNVGDSLITRALSTPGYEYTFLLSLAAKSESIIVAGSVINPKEYPVFYELNSNLSTISSNIDKSLDLKIRTDQIIIKNGFIYTSSSTPIFTTPNAGRHVFSKYDTNYNKIWTRIYIDSILSDESEFAYDVIPLLNNDWMFMGFGFDINSNIQNQDAVYIRVDSIGCLYNTCINVGIQEEIYFDEIIVYPNPASDILNIEHPKHINIYKIKLFDILGKEVSYELLNNNQISIERLEVGVYTLQIMLMNNLVVTRRIIKE